MANAITSADFRIYFASAKSTFSKLIGHAGSTLGSAIQYKESRPGCAGSSKSKSGPTQEPYYRLSRMGKDGKEDWTIGEINAVAKKFEEASVEAGVLLHKHLLPRG